MRSLCLWREMTPSWLRLSPARQRTVERAGGERGLTGQMLGVCHVCLTHHVTLTLTRLDCSAEQTIYNSPVSIVFLLNEREPVNIILLRVKSQDNTNIYSEHFNQSGEARLG